MLSGNWAIIRRRSMDCASWKREKSANSSSSLVVSKSLSLEQRYACEYWRKAPVCPRKDVAVFGL